MDYTFAYPDFFWGLLLIPLLMAWHIVSRKKQVAHLLSSSIDSFSKSGSLAKWRPILLVLRLDMSYLFDGKLNFNEDISNWDVSYKRE